MLPLVPLDETSSSPANKQPRPLEEREGALLCLFKIQRTIDNQPHSKDLPALLEPIIQAAFDSKPNIHLCLTDETPAQEYDLKTSVVVNGAPCGFLAVQYTTEQTNVSKQEDYDLITLGAQLIAQYIEHRELKEKQDHYHTIFNLAQQGIWLLDAKMQTIMVNPALSKMLGYDKTTFIGKSFFDFMPPDSVAKVHKHFKEQTSEPIEQFEIALLTHKGQTIHVAIEASRIHNEGEPSPGLLLGIIDISKRKEHEEKLALLACAFETHEAIAITDTNGDIIRINEAFTKLTGYEESDVLGRNPRILKSGKHDNEFYERLWESLLKTDKHTHDIWNRRKDGELFLCNQTITAVKDDEGHTRYYVSIFMDITQQARDQEWISRQSEHDPLTDLPNRRYFRDRLDQFLEEAKQDQSLACIMFIDLDKFKHINEALGHHIGDQVLRSVGQRLSACLESDDVIARLGGDEFVILVRTLSKNPEKARAQSQKLAEKILAAFRAPFEFEGEAFNIGCNIGMTMAPNNEEDESQELMMQADAAMYHAKTIGRHVYSEYTPEIRRETDERMKFEHRLLEAIENDRITLFYQPQFDDQHRLVGAEALMRWLDDGMAVLSPPEIVKLAEHANLTNALGEWVIKQACRDLSAWQTNSLPNSFEKLSINISPRQFTSKNFAKRTLEIIKEYAIPTEQLMLEVTEEALIEDIDGVVSTMVKLRGEGLRFALDDFGTGFSPLYYLSRLPLTTLKIDQSFVRNLDNIRNTGIVSSIIALGHKLGFDLIAEGVETREQLNKLRSFGCRRFQGYLFSKPVGCSDFIRLMRAHGSDTAHIRPR